MSLESFPSPDGRQPPAQRLVADGDVAGAALLRQETLTFVARHLPGGAMAAQRRVAHVFALLEDAMTPGSRLVVEMDATPVDVQLIARLMRDDGSPISFGLMREGGEIEIWLRLSAAGV